MTTTADRQEQLDILAEKLAFLRDELATAVDPALKFSLIKSIEQTEARSAELARSTRRLAEEDRPFQHTLPKEDHKNLKEHDSGEEVVSDGHPAGKEIGWFAKVPMSPRSSEAWQAEAAIVQQFARIKLESYIDRNLRQVASVYGLIIFVMTVGFVFVSIGVYRAYSYPESLGASIVAACSGILINFIGATFLVVYKATMAQAKDYVSILERINAVGMAAQIVENLGDNEQLKSETSAEISKELLKLYVSSK